MEAPRVPSVERALDLLEVLARSQSGLKLVDISRKLKIPLSSAHYLTQTLEGRGYLERHGKDRDYTLGIRIATLMKAGAVRSLIRNVCSGHLQRLSKTLGFNAVVGRLDGVEATVIDAVTPPGISMIGNHFQLHSTALGKALISHHGDLELENLFEGRKLPRFNQHTIVSLSELRTQLAQICQAGFAVGDQENELGIRCIAAPIFNKLGRVAGALDVSSSSANIAPWQIPHIAAEVMSAARDITRHLCDPLPLADGTAKELNRSIQPTKGLLGKREPLAAHGSQ